MEGEGEGEGEVMLQLRCVRLRCVREPSPWRVSIIFPWE